MECMIQSLASSSQEETICRFKFWKIVAADLALNMKFHLDNRGLQIASLIDLLETNTLPWRDKEVTNSTTDTAAENRSPCLIDLTIGSWRPVVLKIPTENSTSGIIRRDQIPENESC